MSSVYCPYCEAEISSEVSTHADWDEPSFDMRCPECSKSLQIEVTVEEYNYEACKNDDDEESTE